MTLAAALSKITDLLVRYANVPGPEAKLVSSLLEDLEPYDTEAELLADSPSDGVIGFAKDTGSYWFRSIGTWKPTANPAGGGGGVTKYATEVALLAATPDAGTLGFAEDTERTWFFTSFGWKPTPNEFTATNRSAPFEFVVDPVNGDDSPGNDGLLAPLKTLDELMKRLPNRSTQRDATDVIRVLLKAGVHALPSTDGLANDFQFLVRDMPGIDFVGETSAPTHSFVVDSYSLEGMKIHKPAGDPAWVVDELVGKWFDYQFSIDYGPPWGVYSYRYRFPVIANDTHSITVMWQPDATVGGVGWVPPPDVGDTINLADMATVIQGPRLWYVNGSGPVTFSVCKIDGAAMPYGFGYVDNCDLSFNECHLFGNSGWYPPTSSMLFLARQNCHLSFGQCLIEEVYGMIYTQYPTSRVTFGNVAVLNSLRLTEGYLGEIVAWGSILMLRNAGDVFFMSRDQHGILWCDSIYFDNPMGGGWSGALWELANPNVRLDVMGNCRVIDGKSPGTWVNSVGYGNRVRFAQGFSAECSTPANSFKGPNGFTSSIADLKSVYGGEIDFGRGGSVVFFG
jgi:hypothetical protein